MSIKGIIFDYGFTLFQFDNPSVERYYECFKNGLLKSIELLKELNVWNEQSSEDEFIKKFTKTRETFWRQSRKTKEEFPTSKLYQHVLELLWEEQAINSINHLNEKTYLKLQEIYHSFEMEEWKPLPKTKDTLEKLSTFNRIRLGVLSNHPSETMVKQSLKKHSLYKYFDAVVTSAEFGKRKPDPKIFYYTLKKMGLTVNNECLVCGDEYADVVGGDRAGMQTILCERKYKFPFERELDVQDLIRIDDISEILKHLD